MSVGTKLMLERTILGSEPRRGGKVGALAEKAEIDNVRVGVPHCLALSSLHLYLDVLRDRPRSLR